MSPRPDLSDYVEVSERIIEFRQKFPDGSLSAEVILWPTKELPFLAVKAYAHRSRKDETPGVGHAWEPFPGRTPYTKDSELQNAETSAVGRAIVFALAADVRRGVASADEVRNRRAPESTQARGSGTEAGAVVARDAVPASQLSAHKAEAGSVAGAVGDKGEGSSAPATAHTRHTHTFTDQPFEYDGQSIPVRPGFEVCTKCLNGRKKAA